MLMECCVKGKDRNFKKVMRMLKKEDKMLKELSKKIISGKMSLAEGLDKVSSKHKRELIDMTRKMQAGKEC